MAADPTPVYTPYVPRILAEWHFEAPGQDWQRIDGTLCLIDISGFTNLSEKLAAKGRIGAEELTEVLDRVFGNMLKLAYDRGGSLLKFGGDALLLLFEGPDHPLQGASAAIEMRAALREASKLSTSVGRINLRMSVGLHSGPVDLFRAGESHHELVITGEAATQTTEMEHSADAGEILISPSLRALLPDGAAPTRKAGGYLLKWRKPPVPSRGASPRRPVDETDMASAVPTALRMFLAAGRPEAEHRISTIAFVQFNGVENAIAEGGLDGVGAALRNLITNIQEAVEIEGITFLATDIDADGGKVILSAGVPSTQEDDEGRMLRALRRIMDAEGALPLRSGVNRGHVFAGEIGTAFRRTYTVMGDTVNLAARLMATAPPGALYASPEVLDRSTTLFQTEALEPFNVKGKDQPVQAYEVLHETGSRTLPRHHELPFVGRRAELNALAEALNGLDSGAGRAITIAGDTGMGKSRLVAEATDSYSDLSRFLVQAETNGANNAYWAFRNPLRQLLNIERRSQAQMAEDLTTAVRALIPEYEWALPLFGDVGHIEIPDTPETAAIESRFRPDRTADVMIELLQACHAGPLVILGEGAQWLDEASTVLMQRLATATGSKPWLVLLTSRTTDDSYGPLGEEIRLQALPDDEARELALLATGAAPLRPHDLEAVIRRAGGNPLFLSEILAVVRQAGGVENLPDSLDAVVGAEIDSLPPLTRRFLRYASVLGGSFRRVVLDEFLRPEGFELDAATRRAVDRFITPDGPKRWRFRHAVVHSVAYEGLPFRRRRELHARAGEVIERLAGPDPESVAEFLATHFWLGRNYEKAWNYAVLAGDRSAARYANNEAAEQYRIAADASRRIDSVGPEERSRVLEALGDVCDTAGRYEDAEKAYQDARTLLAGDLMGQGRLMAKLGLIREKSGQLPVALRWFKRGLNLVAGAAEAGESKVELSLAYGGVRFRQGRFRDTIEWCKSALDEPSITDAQRAHALYLLVTAYAHVGSPEAVVAGQKALEIYERIGDLVGTGNVLNNLGVHAYYRGEWDEALDLWSKSEEARRRSGDLIGAAASVNNLAEVYSDQGRLEEAEQMFRRALYEWNSGGIKAGVALAHLNLGRALTRSGRFDDATACLEEGLRLFDEIGAQSYVYEAQLRQAELHLFSRRFQDAATLASQVLRKLGRDESTLMQRTALRRVLGYCEAARGNIGLVSRELHSSLKFATQAKAEFETAQTLEALARLLPNDPNRPNWDDDQAGRLERLGVIATPLIPIS